MNKKIIALGMASAMAIAAVFTTAVPVSAQVTTTISYQNDAFMSFDHLVGENDPYHAENTSSTIAIGEQRTAIVGGTIETTTTDTINKKTYLGYDDEGDFGPIETGTTKTYKHLSVADFTNWQSDTPAVATVTNGVVTGVSSGSAWISASYTWTDANGVAQAPINIGAWIYVQKAPVDDYVIPVQVDLAVGETFTIPSPPVTYRKGTQVDASFIEFDDDDFGEEFGDDAKWDDAKKVFSGSIASFDKTTKALTAKAAGNISIRFGYKTAENNVEHWGHYYIFHIKEAVGSVVPDDYGEANYKILNAHEVAYAGMVKVTNKPVIPSEVFINNTEYDVVEIADGAFKGTSIVSVTVPVQLKKIGASAFENCKKLTSLDISSTDVEQIGAAAFAGCVKCKELTVNGDKVKTYGAGAFKKFKKKNVINVEASSKKVFKSASKKIKKAGGKKAKIVEQD
ncbi:leucine-rich repeat domain-containing protein [Butyrivibrio sp. AD3002]|uniref:leucine-rich repeat domain-containing protein n=1 Tax=Butyrivibrio sp. AD3002 TaxID=1280670 RepID=UPI0003B75D51|nr:leucine-rich repeat domain-containing protein [Butyrivibrio sp. AD3002]